MKKEVVLKDKSKLRFELLRALALAAFFCTLILALVIFVESGTPGGESAKHSSFISEGIKNVVDINDNEQSYATSRIVASSPMTHTVGETAQIQLTLYPKGATDRDVTYTSSNPEAVSVDENGVATFHKLGSSTIEVVLKSNPEVKATLSAICVGAAITNDTHIMKLGLSLSDGYTRGGTQTQPITVSEGESLYGHLYDDQSNAYEISRFSVTMSDESLFTRFYGSLTAVKAGSTTMRFEYDDDENNVHISSDEFTVNVQKTDGFVIPQQFEFEEEVHFGLDERIDPYKLVQNATPGAAEPSGDNIAFYMKSNDGCLIALSSNNQYKAIDAGKAKLEVSSRYNPDCKALITIIVDEPTPTTLRIVGNDRIAVDSQYRYYAYGDSTYINDVTWSVVKGHVDIEDGGLIRSRSMGTMVIRATSNKDPSVYAEMTVTVSLFDNFGLFVRKVIGHFGLFVVLGIGLATSLFMLLKPRWLYAIIAPVLGLLSAMLSEALQLPAITTGRYASWTDVAIDFTGALVGIVLVTAVALIYIAIRKHSKTYDQTRSAFSKLSFRSAFRKYPE